MISSEEFSKVMARLELGKRSIFVMGDPGVTSMQEELRGLKQQLYRDGEIGPEDYENPNGVFLRVKSHQNIYSGIIQATDESETRSMLLNIPVKLREENVGLLAILKLPMIRKPLFPFFTILDDSSLRQSIENETKRYWDKFSSSIDALESWYADYIHCLREIVFREVPELEPAVPFWMENLSVFVLYNEEDRVIAARYYRSMQNRDIVIVKETSEPVGRKTQEIFSRLFDLPPEQDCISENIQFSRIGEHAYSGWSHPYFSAVKTLREQVRRFNKAQPTVFYDAHYLSNALIHNWTLNEIEKVRKLVKEHPFLKETFRLWTRGVEVLHRYFIGEPKKGWVTDGTIVSYYVNGPDDKILVERVDDKDKVQYDENVVARYFPESTGKPFIARQSSILWYLRDKVGSDF